MKKMDMKDVKYQFKYRTKVSDLWQLSMYYAYSSYLATVNVICIISSIVLLVRFHDTAKWLGIAAMVFFVLLFTVIQPVSVYSRAKRQLKGHEKDVVLEFTDSNLIVRCDGQEQIKSFDEIYSVLIKPTLVAIYASKSEGYIITNRVLKDKRKSFISFINKI